MPQAQQRWIHSCCSQDKLAQALADPTITAIETDIVAGPEPTLAHPPATSSDLPLDEFLERCIADGKRHLKLDFKELSIVESVLQRVALAWPRLAANGQAVWLNADILPGPNKREADIPIPPGAFVPLCRRLCPHAMLSLGWRTAPSGPEEAYTQGDVDAMARLCSEHSIPGTAVVFAVNARYAEGALPPLVELLAALPQSQMLLWTGTGEPPFFRLESKVRVLAAFAAAGFPDAVGFDVQLAASADQERFHPKALMVDGRYTHATCGMHAKLLAKVRAAAAAGGAALEDLCLVLAACATARLKSDTAAAVVVAPPLGPPTCVIGDGDPLVVVWLMLDPLDIDSKQTTFCRGADATRSMQSLYKWTGSATPPPHTELPGAIAE